MRALLLALALSACSSPAPSEPDAAPPPDADVCDLDDVPLDRCERYQQAPAPCYADPCECGERTCGNENQCREWEDTGSFGCRVLFFCECR